MHAPSTGFSQWYTKPIRVLQDGPCIFPTFKCPSKSKMNSEKQKSKFRYSFWKLIPKTKRGSQISAFRFGTSAPKRKAEVKFRLFIFGIFTPKQKAEVKFPLFVLVLSLQSKNSAFHLETSTPKRKAKAKFPLFILDFDIEFLDYHGIIM